jgi:acetoin utilization protein AcuB
MTKSIPQVQRFMSTSPLTVNSDLTLLQAKQLMMDHSIRHLPVLEESHLVGIISEKDINFIQGFRGVDLKIEKVSSAMTSDPYVVQANSYLDEVCKYMSHNKIGSVLVQDNKKLVGIFTWVDALSAMSELLHTRLG